MMSIDSVFKSIQDFFATQNVRLFSRHQSENEFESIVASAIESGTLNKRDPDSKQKSPEAPYNSFNVDPPSGFSGYRELPVGFTETPQIIEEVSLFCMPDDV